MRQFILLIGMSFISLNSFAVSPDMNQKLSSAWKIEQSMHAQAVPNEFAMVYGGADITSKPHLPHPTAMA